MPSPAAIQAAHARAIAALGRAVTFRRSSAGGSDLAEAAVTAVVRRVRVNTTAATQEGFLTTKPNAPSVADREVLVMSADLAAAGFPLPVVKGDRIRIADTGEWLQVDTVDDGKRYIAGCIELTAKGLA